MAQQHERISQDWNVDMNSEQQANAEPAAEEQTPAIAPDQSLTLGRKKLAGSAQCLNCGTDLKGPFCYFCGQPDRNFMRFFPALLRDLMEDLLDLDSRFIRTLKPLLFKPGRLTRDYMNGRRFRYAPPMRVYIFSSIVFFLLAALLSSNSISLENRDGDLIQIVPDSAQDKEKVEQALNNLPPDVREKIDVEQVLEEVHNEETDEAGFDLDDIQFNDEPWNRETNPVDIKWLPDWLNDRINDEIEGSPQKTKQINENPNLFVDKVFDVLPITMFLLLPVVALIFKFWYLFAKRYYVEHLIFSLHNHSFMFVTMVLILLTNLVGDLLTSYGYTGAETGAGWLMVILGVWIPVYLLISLRTVYQQNWALTLGKFFVIGISYVTLLAFVTTVVAIASFVLL
jgi:hypothetical protein